MCRSRDDGIETAHSSCTVSPAKTVLLDGLATRFMAGLPADSSNDHNTHVQYRQCLILSSVLKVTERFLAMMKQNHRMPSDKSMNFPLKLS